MRTLTTSTAAKLFATGFTIGPLVDSLHNQCLLRYDVLPISLELPGQNGLLNAAISVTSSTYFNDATVGDSSYFFCSSWVVPPLLGFAYVVLGGILPRIAESILEPATKQEIEVKSSPESWTSPPSSQRLRTRAILAVTTTAMIIKLSEFFETHPGFFDYIGVLRDGVEPTFLSLLTMIVATIFQWALLDGSIVALLVASVTAVCGPLAELPFVGHGAWTYIEDAADYFPLQNLFASITSNAIVDNNSVYPYFSQALFGTSDYQDLALSSITGPCYFAVAMDAIALGRWFDASTQQQSLSLESINPDDKKS